jgi:hypothetical protein
MTEPAASTSLSLTTEQALRLFALSLESAQRQGLSAPEDSAPLDAQIAVFDREIEALHRQIAAQKNSSSDDVPDYPDPEGAVAEMTGLRDQLIAAQLEILKLKRIKVLYEALLRHLLAGAPPAQDG